MVFCYSNAFVDLEDASELETALALNGSELKKNTITVEKAKPRGQREQNNQSFGSPGDRFSKGGDDDSKYIFQNIHTPLPFEGKKTIGMFMTSQGMVLA